MKHACAALLLAAPTLAVVAQAAQHHPIPAAIHKLQVRVERDIVYGTHPYQRLDAYLPKAAKGPILLVVHGGAWVGGDKRSASMLLPRVRHWTARGFVVASTNYRLRAEADPLEQARDVARALALVQERASGWAADPQRVVLMGHGAGGHLVALLNAAPALARQQGAGPWLGTISLDSAALDVPSLMANGPLYGIFGEDPAFWRAVSPLHRLSADAPPLLVVCARGAGRACAQAEALRQVGARWGRKVTVQSVAKTNIEINRQLGLPGAYTASVDRWINSIL